MANIARVGDAVMHGGGAGTIVSGSATVFAEGKPVARVGDTAVCSCYKGGGKIVSGSGLALS